MHRPQQSLIPGLFLPLICSTLWPILLLSAPLACYSETVQNFIDKAAPIGSISLPSLTFSGTANCGSKINSSHATNGFVSITGSASTTIDCSGTGLRCLYISDVSVVIQKVTFVGNREMFPQTIIPVAPTSRPHAHTASHDRSSPVSEFEREFASGAQRGRGDPTVPPDKIFNLHSHLNSVFPPLRTSQQPSGDTVQSFSSRVSSTVAAQNIPVAGGCILIFNSSSVTVQDCSFSKCASSVVGGSVAMFLVTSAQLSRSKFIDSILNVQNSAAEIESDPDQIIEKASSSGSVFTKFGTKPTLGYGGALFISPKLVSGILISIGGCEFLRCAVLTKIDSEAESFLQGGAFATFLPFVNKSSASDQGYLLSIANSSFSQCAILHSSTTLRNGLDVMSGGAVSVYEFSSINYNTSFVLPRNRLILQNVKLSGNVISRQQNSSAYKNGSAYEVVAVGGSFCLFVTADVSISHVDDENSFTSIETAQNVEGGTRLVTAAYAGSIAINNRLTIAMSNVNINSCSAGSIYNGVSGSSASAVGGACLLSSNLSPFVDITRRRYIYTSPSRYSLTASTFNRNAATSSHYVIANYSIDSILTVLGGAIAILHSDDFCSLGNNQCESPDGESLDHYLSFSVVNFSNNSANAAFPNRISVPVSASVANSVVLGGSLFVHASPINTSSAQYSPGVLSLSIADSNFLNSTCLFDSESFNSSLLFQKCKGYVGGGALFVRSFASVITSSSFSGNLARTRPFAGAFDSGPTLLTPAFANGGAILLRGTERSPSSSANSTTSVSAVVYNCSISKNAASGAGSAIFAESSSILNLSHSVLSYNYGFIAALACQGKVNIASTKFANNTAAVVSTDFFLSCASECGANVSSTTFALLEGAAYSIQQNQGANRTETILFNQKVCDITFFTVQGNNYAPIMFVDIDNQFFDSRNSQGNCSTKSLITAVVDSTASSVFAPDLMCSSGQVPTFSRSISAVFSTVSLSQIRTVLYPYPSFSKQTDLIPVLKSQYSCRPCPANTFQGLKLLSLSNRDVSDTSDESAFFCKPCPSGADCTDPSVLKATPGFFLWETNDPNNFNITKNAKRLPPGYGAEPSSANASGVRQGIRSNVSWLNPCRPGSNRQGVLCGQCRPGFSAALFTTNCVENSTCGNGPWFFVVVTIIGLAISLFFLVTSSKPEVSFFDGALQVVSLHFQLMGLIMAFYISSFQDAMQQFVTFFKSFFSFQASSNDSGGGLCLYPSMTTKGTIAMQISFYAIIVLDFLVLAYFWPRIRTPVLSFVEKCLEVKDVFARRVIRQVEQIRIFHASEAPKTAVAGFIDPPTTARELAAVSDSLLDREPSIVAFPASAVAESVPSATETRGAAALQLFLFVYISPVELSLQLLHCITLENLTLNGTEAYQLRWWYDGSETCVSSWQAGPIVLCCCLALLPLMMILRAMWLKRRMWSNRAGVQTRGWFWEASYYEFYSSSFTDSCPHWLPIQLSLRVAVLGASLIPEDYWKLFSFFMIIFLFFIFEMIFKPWRLRDVQIFSSMSYFILLLVLFILARPATNQANAMIDSQQDSFGKVTFVVFFFLVILAIIPLGFGLVVISRNTQLLK